MRATATVPDAPPLRQVRRARSARRVGAVLLVAFVLAGAAGAFGTRTRTASAEGGGYRVAVDYPTVSRPGHAVRFDVRVHRAGGFPDPIRVRMASAYFDLFDENGFDPDPDSSTTDAGYDYYEFSPPAGEDFTISSDTRVEPDRQRGARGEVSVLAADGRPLVTVRFRTRVVP